MLIHSEAGRPGFAGTLVAHIMLLCFLGIPGEARAAMEDVLQSLPEEVVITSQQPLYELRSRMWEAEQEAYSLFNQFNDDKRFEIQCTRRAPTGSRISRQDCDTAFERQANAEHAAAYTESVRAALGQGGSPFAMPSVPREAAIARHQRAYKAKMQEIAREHPEFLEAIVAYSELRERYEAAAGNGGEAD